MFAFVTTLILETAIIDSAKLPRVAACAATGTRLHLGSSKTPFNQCFTLSDLLSCNTAGLSLSTEMLDLASVRHIGQVLTP